MRPVFSKRRERDNYSRYFPIERSPRAHCVLFHNWFATKQPTINSEYSMGNNTQTRDVYAYSSLRNCTGEWHHDQSNSSFYLHRTPKVMFSSLVVCCFLLLPVGNITHKRVNGLSWYFRDRSDIIQGINWNILEIQHPYIYKWYIYIYIYIIRWDMRQLVTLRKTVVWIFLIKNSE